MQTVPIHPRMGAIPSDVGNIELKMHMAEHRSTFAKLCVELNKPRVFPRWDYDRDMAQCLICQCSFERIDAEGRRGGFWDMIISRCRHISLPLGDDDEADWRYDPANTVHKQFTFYCNDCWDTHWALDDEYRNE
jgi:hypothetical protein